MLSPPQRRLDVNGAGPSDVMEYREGAICGKVVPAAGARRFFLTNGVNRLRLEGTSVSAGVTKVKLGSYPYSAVAWTPATANGGEP